MFNSKGENVNIFVVGCKNQFVQIKNYGYGTLVSDCDLKES